MIVRNIRVTNCYERSSVGRIEGHFYRRIGVVVVELSRPPRLDYAMEGFELDCRADDVITPSAELAADYGVHDRFASGHGGMQFARQPCEIDVLARGRNLTSHLE